MYPRRIALLAALTTLLFGCPQEEEPNTPPTMNRPDADMTTTPDDMPVGVEDMDMPTTEQDLSMPDQGPDMTSPDMPPAEMGMPIPVGLALTEADPGGGSMVAPDAKFTLRFDRAVSRTTLRISAVNGACQGPIQLKHDASDRCISGWTKQVDERTLEIMPRQPLVHGAAYTLSVVAGQALGVDGTTLAQTATRGYQVTPRQETPYSRTVDMNAPLDFTEQERLPTSDGKQIYVSWDAENLYVGIAGEDLSRTNMAAYVAIGATPDAEALGAAYAPPGRWFEGSTTLLPIHASHLFMVKAVNEAPETNMRRWSGVAWGARQPAGDQMVVRYDGQNTRIAIRRSALGQTRQLDVAVYMKDLASDGAGQREPGWGWTFGASDPLFEQGPDDRILSTALRIDTGSSKAPGEHELIRRFGRDLTRARFYQLMVRTFGNTNETRRPNGTRDENGTGTFDDINEAAVASFKQMGYTHVWLTGVLQQATSTDYSSIGQPADDPDILKGLAGSPYAIRDYFDVSPDYARDPAKRQEALRAAIDRMHDQGLKVVIDFVPNHVARSYQTDLYPQLNFGDGDNQGAFYARDNHFFYLQSGQPPILMPGHDRNGNAISPTCQTLVMRGGEYQCDGFYNWQGRGEMMFGRVTGNNVTSWSPHIDTWYETVKLNYGFDFTNGRVDHPHDGSPELAIPRTWLIMDAIIAHWQSLGVDGFRADMVHMVPMAFQSWLIARSRARNPDVIWVAEAYDTDPAKVVSGNVLHALLGAGYDAVYDDETYDQLKEVFDGGAWLNDLDNVLGGDHILVHHALRYAENHDEVRLASRHDWRFNGSNVGGQLGPAITAILHGIGRGPTMMFAGQETGEPAAGAEGFGGDDGRTTIFDYWSMPTFVGWVNGHRYDGGGLDAGARELRERYAQTLEALSHLAIERGALWRLNSANVNHAPFGRASGETASGHYSYAYLRYIGGEAVLIYAWLHPTQTASNVSVIIPDAAWQAAGLPAEATLTSRTSAMLPSANVSREQAQQGVSLGDVAPGQVRVVVLR